MLERPSKPDADSEAIARLSDLTGIDIAHFRAKRTIRDPATHGAVALRNLVRIVNPFADEPIEGVADRVALSAAVATHYGKDPAGWEATLGSIVDHFFTARPLSLFSPLDGEALPLRAEVLGTRTRWMQWIVLGKRRLRILALEANTPVGIWYPERNEFLLVRTGIPKPEEFVRHMVYAVVERPAAFLRWLEAASHRRARRAFIVGEARPSHFMAQTLGFLHRHMQDRILPFLEEGHLLVILSDRSFIQPLTVFPELRNRATLMVSVQEAPALLAGLGLHCRLNDRRIGNTDYGWTARLGGRTAEADEYGVWVGIDAERMRFDNQVEGFAACLRRLADVAKGEGRRLKVYWDGWTLAAGNRPRERDLEVIGRIDEIAARIKAMLPQDVAEERLQGRSAEEKIGLASGCRIAIATFGTATILPTCALGIPTVTYHAPAMFDAIPIASGKYCDPAHTLPVPPEAITLVGGMAAEPHKQVFAVAVPALLATLEQAITVSSATAAN